MKRVLLFIGLTIMFTALSAQKPTMEGSWELEYENGKPQILLRQDRDKHSSSRYGDDISLSDLKGLKEGKDVEFYLENDQGRIVFRGEVSKNGGEGTFEFYTDESFLSAMADRAYPDFKAGELLLFTMKDYGIQEIDELQALGYENIGRKIVSLCALGIDAAYIKEIHEAGFPDISIQNIISFKALGVNADKIKELNSIFGDNLSVGDITSFTALKIDPEYVREIHSTGLDVKPQQLISFKALGITPEYIKMIQNAGIGEVDASSFPALKSQNIDVEFVQEVKAMGFKDVNQSTLIKLKVFNFDKEYVNMIRNAGYEDISLDDILQFKVMKIDADFIRKAKEFNNGQLPKPNKLVGLKAMEGSAHKH